MHEGVLSECGADVAGLGVFKRHGKGAGLQDSLERLGLLERVVARDGDVAVGDRGLHGRGALDHAVKQDGDTALRVGQNPRHVTEGLGALGVEVQVHGVIGAARALHADGDALDLVAGHEGLIGAGLKLHARGAGVDLGQGVLVGDVVEVDELKGAGGTHGVDDLLGVGGARNLDENLVRALTLNGGLAGAQGVHAVRDDCHGRLHVGVGDVRPIGLVGGHDDRDAALDVEALRNLLVKRPEAHEAHGKQHDKHHEHTHIATHVGLHRLLVRLLLGFLRCGSRRARGFRPGLSHAVRLSVLIRHISSLVCRARDNTRLGTDRLRQYKPN